MGKPKKAQKKAKLAIASAHKTLEKATEQQDKNMAAAIKSYNHHSSQSSIETVAKKFNLSKSTLQ